MILAQFVNDVTELQVEGLFNDSSFSIMKFVSYRPILSVYWQQLLLSEDMKLHRSLSWFLDTFLLLKFENIQIFRHIIATFSLPTASIASKRWYSIYIKLLKQSNFKSLPFRSSWTLKNKFSQEKQSTHIKIDQKQISYTKIGVLKLVISIFLVNQAPRESFYSFYLICCMEEELTLSVIHKAQMMDEEYPDSKNDSKIDIFQHLLKQPFQDNEMEIEQMGKLIHSQSSHTLNRHSDFKKFLNSSASNQRLIPSSIKHNSSRENSSGGQMKCQTQKSFDSESVRKSFKKKFQQSFSMSQTIRDSSSQFSQRSDSKSSRNIIIIPPQDQQQRIDEQKKAGCNCRRSKCLKLYCQCFQKQMFCSKSCNCHNCGNHLNNKDEHKKAIIEALARNAHTMTHGFENEKKVEEEKKEELKLFSLGVQHEQVKKGCKCKKTKCLKKYCECYQRGVHCTVFCRCQGCYNKQSTNEEMPCDHNNFVPVLENI